MNLSEHLLTKDYRQQPKFVIVIFIPQHPPAKFPYKIVCLHSSSDIWCMVAMTNTAQGNVHT